MELAHHNYAVYGIFKNFRNFNFQGYLTLKFLEKFDVSGSKLMT